MPDPPRLTDLERARIEVEALIPIIRAFEEELGSDRAHEIVARARAGKTKADLRKALDGKRLTRMPFTERGMVETAAAGGALEYEILREDEEAFDFNVTRCRYKEMMQELDALDLGALLLCDGDFPAAEAWGLDLQRTRTCMQGASQCDFRYRLRRS
jgi:hypothetical protein